MTGYIVDATDDDGVTMIPAPPSEEMDNVNQQCGGVSSAAASVSSSCPSRDSVSAAIALVRAKQMAKSAILRAEEQILQPRPIPSDQTATSGTTESSSKKERVASVGTIFENENEVPIMSTRKEMNSSSLAEDVIASNPVLESACSLNNCLPLGPSFESTPDQVSPAEAATEAATEESQSDTIPAPPSFGSNESAGNGFDGSAKTNTIDDVNAFLSRLGVGSLHSASAKSIDKLHELSSGASGASYDGMNSHGSAPLEVQPSSLAEISSLIDFVREEHIAKKKLSTDTTMENESNASKDGNDIHSSWLSPIYDFLNQTDPPTSHAAETQKDDNADTSGQAHPSDTDESNYSRKEENPFIDHSYSGDAFEDSPQTPRGNAIEDEKKTDESNEKNVPVGTRFGDESFAADVHKTLSTVQEVASMEVDDEESAKEDFGHSGSSSKPVSENVPGSQALSVVDSEEQESVYGDDGRKEPKGLYEKADVEVEKIPISNVGVEHVIKNNLSLMSTDSTRIGTERQGRLEQSESQNKFKGSENHETRDSASIGSQGYSDNGSLPWALRDVASEETLRATGRRRPHFVVSGPRPSHRSRNVASLFDDTSQQASETASEFRSGLSFGSDNRSDEHEPTNVEEEESDSDSVEADNRCMIDHFLYNKYEPENDYQVQDNESKTDKTGKPALVHSNSNTLISSSALVGGESVKVQTIIEQQSEEPDIPKMEIGKFEKLVEEENEKTSVVALSAEIGDEVATEKEKKMEEESNPFLRQFEDLDLDDESDDEAEVQVDDDAEPKTQEGVEKGVAHHMSPAELVTYFSSIDEDNIERECDRKFIDEFKGLMMPVVNGKIPTIIEEAQIRQAALKANVPLGYVDAFIDYVKDEKLEVAPQLSKEQPSSEKSSPSKSSEEIEDLDEDDAIAAFLSPKTDCQDLIEEEAFKPSEETSVANVEQEKEDSEQACGGNDDSEPSATSNISHDGQAGSDLKTGEASKVEKRVAEGGGSRGDTIELVKESDRCVVESEKGASNGHDKSKKLNDEKNENLVNNSEAMEKISQDDSEPVDIKMLQACESIESYDEGIWQRRTAMATYGWEWEEATWLSPKTTPSRSIFSDRGIHGVTAVRDVTNFMFNKRSFPVSRKFCKFSYNRRVKPHKGYFDVDMFSLQESAVAGKENMYKDETPWELRQVRQRFLHERSLTFSRNWFGELVKTSGNDKIKAPTCKPKSMEMPMRKIPDPGDWTPEWYTSWGGRKLLLRRPSFDSSVDSDVESGADTGTDSYTDKDDDKDSLRSYSSAGSSYDDDDDDWEDAPECGTFVNTKLKIGERVTRVHPDYTSSLRKSRWRKKYFPIGTFPY